MAVVNLTFILALAGRLLEQDRLTREGRWADKQDARGTGLVGKTLGTIGFGRIAQETHRITRPLGMRHIASDPYAIAAVAEAEGEIGRASCRERGWSGTGRGCLAERR